MTVLLVLLALLIVALLLWDRLSPRPSERPHQRTLPRAAPPRPRPAARPAVPRFNGLGVVSATQAPQRAGRREGAVRRAAPRARGAAAARFSGGVRRSPNAIGLACGRPISDCTRGADCLCVD